MNSIGRFFVGLMIEDLQKHGVLNFTKENIRFIDIGGASGTYTWAFLETLPKSEGTIFDLPVAIREARRRFAGTPLESRVSFAEGDFYQNELPDEFDFAWVSAITHQHGRVESQALYKKAYRALNSGGRIWGDPVGIVYLDSDKINCYHQGCCTAKIVVRDGATELPVNTSPEERHYALSCHRILYRRFVLRSAAQCQRSDLSSRHSRWKGIGVPKLDPLGKSQQSRKTHSDISRRRIIFLDAASNTLQHTRLWQCRTLIQTRNRV